MVEYFDRSLGYIPSLQIYCYVRGKLACTAIKLSASHCATAIKLLASHYANIRIVCSHLRERPRTNIRPCHCEGVQIDPAIVWVYQSIKRSHCAGIFKQYNPAWLDQNQTACLLAGHN